jgi:hypothetical protein
MSSQERSMTEIINQETVMDGQARVAGRIYKDVLIGDKTYRLSRPHLAGIYGDIERWIINRKKDPMVLAVEACRLAPQEQWKTIWAAAMEAGSAARVASNADLALFWDSRWSSAFLFKQSLDPMHDADVPTVEAAMEVIGSGVDVDQVLFDSITSSMDVELLLRRLVSSGVDLDALLAQIHVVSGQADIKNSSGLSNPAQATPLTDSQTTAAGPDSTATSPPSTDGLQSK